MTAPRQSLDRSSDSLLVRCECGWRQLVDNPIEGWTVARNHGWAVHADGDRARAALNKAVAYKRKRTA